MSFIPENLWWHKEPMMKKLLSLMTAVSLILALTVGCGSRTPTEGYDYKKDTLTVNLEANPTTGFTWGAAIADEAVLSFVSDCYEAPSTKTAIAGAGGFDTLTFKAVGEGTTTVTLTYAQQWEGGESSRVETLQIVVDGDKTIKEVTGMTLQNG